MEILNILGSSQLRFQYQSFRFHQILSWNDAIMTDWIEFKVCQDSSEN